MPPKRTQKTTSPIRDKKKKGGVSDNENVGGDGSSGSRGGGGGSGSGGRESGGSDGGDGTVRQGRGNAIPMSQAQIQNLVKMAYQQGVEEGRRAVGLDLPPEGSADETHLRRCPRLTPRTPQPRHADQEQ